MTLATPIRRHSGLNFTFEVEVFDAERDVKDLTGAVVTGRLRNDDSGVVSLITAGLLDGQAGLLSVGIDGALLTVGLHLVQIEVTVDGESEIVFERTIEVVERILPL